MATRFRSMLPTRTKTLSAARAMNFKVDKTYATPTAIRSFATRTMPSFRVKQDTVSPLYRFGGVHGSGSGQKTWRNKPLFRREVCPKSSPSLAI